MEIEAIGTPINPNPIETNDYTDDNKRIAFSSQFKNILKQIDECEKLPSFEKAGIHKNYFTSQETPKSQSLRVADCAQD